ncbi:MAG TPA: YbhB/YbcL family Raf kinase inhibitor-like protein [Actinophytocola sp.]|nr:YbhB/YbcL family Raf kinase inhibitor-like protein [Actinophytocola sp.]
MGDPERAAGPTGTRGTSRGDPSIDEPATPVSGGLMLRSAAFTEHTLIPDRYSYDGGNVSPPLEWSRPPDGTAELVLLCEDPDAPGGTFTHWVLTGIHPETSGVEEGTLPPHTAAGRNGFDEPGWGGPRPPVGDDPHRYFFRLHAVDRPLDLGDRPTADEVHRALRGHVLATGNLVGTFGR